MSESPGPDLRERVAIVTGGGRRLGRAIALAYARAGADVVITAALTPHQAEEVAPAGATLPGSIHALAADVMDPPDVDRVDEHALEFRGSIDVLVNNAARGVHVNLLAPGGATATGMVPDDTPASIELLSPEIVAGPALHLALTDRSAQRIVGTEWAEARPYLRGGSFPVHQRATGDGEPLVNNEFNVAERHQGAASILTVSGELDLRTSPELEIRLGGVFDSGAELVILDLRQIEFMDSTGLRVLLAAHQRAHESGRRFALVKGADQVERVLTLTGVRDLLTVVDAPEDLLTAGEASSEGA